MRGESRTWVTTFDGQLGRVYARGEDGNLHHLPSEGMDARHDAESRRDTGSLNNAPLKQTGPVGMITEPDFVTEFTNHLAACAKRGAFDRLIVSAAPTALAVFRQNAPQELKGKVAVELNKDYVHTPIKQLEAAVSEHL